MHNLYQPPSLAPLLSADSSDFHLGLSAEDADNPFKRKAAEERKRRQEEAEAKAAQVAEAKAKKAAAKKKLNQAPEDDWFFDGSSPIDAEADPDDDTGFQMMTKQDINTDTQFARPSMLKVTNLIDMSECNTMTEETLEQCETGLTITQTVAKEHNFEVEGADNLQLLQEIALLRQQLSDAHVEAAIQVDIVKDALAEKSLQVDELERLRAEDEASLRQARARVQELELAVTSNVSGSIPPPASASLGSEDALSSLVTEVRQFCDQARRNLKVAAVPEPTAGGDVGAQLRSLRDAMSALQQEACSAATALPSPGKPRPVNGDAAVLDGSAERMDRMSQLALEATDAAREMRANTQLQLEWFTTLLSNTQPRQQ